MELLAIYIDNHVPFKDPIYLNFGGKYIFDFKLIDGTLRVSKNNNEQYITGFFNESISNISAIVGNNGVGKTSIMRCLNNSSDCLSIYSEDEKIFIKNNKLRALKCDFDYENHDELEENKYQKELYYSGNIDFKLRDIKSPISESNRFKGGLFEYYLDTIFDQVLFLNQKGQYIHKHHQELPFYDDVKFSINNVSKEDFIETITKTENEINDDRIIRISKIWESYPLKYNYKIDTRNGFLENLELLTLSLLIADRSDLTKDIEKYDITKFEKVIKQRDFDNILEYLLRLKFQNLSSNYFESKGIKFEELLKSNEDEHKNLRRNFKEGENSDVFKAREFIKIIFKYEKIKKLHEFVKNNIKLVDEGFLHIDVKHSNSEILLKELLDLIKKVKYSFNSTIFEFRFFNISSDRRMSTGELSILNMYSSIYAYISKLKVEDRKESYLFLLDEPEQGYHATWKKKFIKTINDTLPELFSDFDSLPSIQIIFTTHDPLTLSDIPNDKISYLKSLDKDNIKVFHIGDPDRPTKSFGANITELLADSFFIDDGLMGDFAKEKINDLLKYLTYDNDKEVSSTNEKPDIDWSASKAEKFINIIGEPLLEYDLKELYLSKFYDEKKIDDEIAKLQELKQKRRNDIN